MIYKTIAIQFNHSTSPQFEFALREAQKQASFKKENKTYSVTYSHGESETLHKLLDHLRNFRNRRVFIDGEEKPWDEVFQYLNCYRMRQRAYDAEEYCSGDSRQFPAFNPWGCIQTFMPLSNDTEWLHYGRFDLDGTWIFDKEKIKHYLIANTHPFRFCPALNPEEMMAILAAFPETVNPQMDRNWEYSTALDRHIMAGITISTGSQENIYVCGVKPSSPAAIREIYQKIMDKLH